MVEKKTKWEIYQSSKILEKIHLIYFLVISIDKLCSRLKENDLWDKDDYSSIARLLWERQRELKNAREISGVFSIENILGSLGIFWSIVFIIMLYYYFQYFLGLGIGLML